MFVHTFLRPYYSLNANSLLLLFQDSWPLSNDIFIVNINNYNLAATINTFLTINILFNIRIFKS